MEPESESSASRVDRLNEHRKGRRWWVALAVVMSLALIASVVTGVFLLLRNAEAAPPSRVVLASEAKLQDATTVAGLISVIDKQGALLTARGVDSGRAVSIPGTSYNRLADALPLGGGDMIAELLYPGDDTVAWIILTPEGAARLIDANGGVRIDVPAETTVFTGDELFRFNAGEQKLSGAQAVALSLGAETFGRAEAEAVRITLAQSLGDAAVEQPDVLGDLVGSGLGESSVNDQALAAFFGR